MNTQIDPGPGWRLLRVGEKPDKKFGDEYIAGAGWLPTLYEGDDPILEDMIYRRRITADAPKWPTPIATKDRLPTKEDADKNGYVLAADTYRSWLRTPFDFAGNYAFWMPQPPAPVPPKSDAELAFEKHCAENIIGKHDPAYKVGFLTGFNAAKKL